MSILASHRLCILAHLTCTYHRVCKIELNNLHRHITVIHFDIFVETPTFQMLQHTAVPLGNVELFKGIDSETHI